MNSKPFQNSLSLQPLRVVRAEQVQRPRLKQRGSHNARRSQITLWYALWLPQLNQPSVAGPQQQTLAQEIAEGLSTLSATVSIAASDSFLFEVGSMLRYFGGIEKIRGKVHALLEPMLLAWGLPQHFHEAASPTPAASLLLARAACNLLVYHKDNLRAALGHLPLHTLPLPERKKRQFHNSGLYILRDIWRLPSAALTQRFGYAFTKQLEQCLGHVANPVKAYQSPPRFSSAIECPYAIEKTQALLPGIEELLERLCLFLYARELAATHLCLLLHHEHQAPTQIDISLRQASRTHAHFMLLLETRLNAQTLPAAVTDIQLCARHFTPFNGQSETLSGVTFARNVNTELSELLPLLEQLQARLGNPAVRSIHCRDEHCPEQAGLDKVFGEEAFSAPGEASHMAQEIPERPCWLLAQPMRLRQEQGHLYYRSSLRLLSGPERIETQWWATQEIRRDYYVARNRQGMRLWIFHERMPQEQKELDAWFLHGIFA